MSMSGRVCTNDFVSLDDRSNADASRIAIRFLIDPDYLAHSPDENLGTASHFGWQSESYIQFRASAQILINCKVNATRRNIARFSVSRGYFLLDWHPNDDRQ